jgi:hypothetical protein
MQTFARRRRKYANTPGLKDWFVQNNLKTGRASSETDAYWGGTKGTTMIFKSVSIVDNFAKKINLVLHRKKTYC